MLFLFLLLSIFALALTQKKDQVFQHPLTNIPSSYEDVKTSTYYPDHPDHKLPVGEPITVLCHFMNDGESAINVTAIMVSM